MIAIDLSKQIDLGNPNAMQQINFTSSLDRNEGVTMFLIIEKTEEATFDFSQNAVSII